MHAVVFVGNRRREVVFSDAGVSCDFRPLRRLGEAALLLLDWRPEMGSRAVLAARLFAEPIGATVEVREGDPPGVVVPSVPANAVL